jgi:hypothetical protein
MIIQTNSQTAGHGNLLNPAGGFQSKAPSQGAKGNDSSEGTHNGIRSTRIDGIQSRVMDITDTDQAEGAVIFARNFIGTNPSGAIGVQANTNASTVLNLLGELVYS